MMSRSIVRLATASFTVCTVVLFSLRCARGEDSHYVPVVSGPPAATLVGRLIDMGFGMASGGLTIRTSLGRTIDIYAANAPFRIDGRTIDCPSPPRNTFVPTPADCPRWPAHVVIGSTRATIVSVPVWRGRRDGRPTLVTNGFRTLRRRSIALGF